MPVKYFLKQDLLGQQSINCCYAQLAITPCTYSDDVFGDNNGKYFFFFFFSYIKFFFFFFFYLFLYLFFFFFFFFFPYKILAPLSFPPLSYNRSALPIFPILYLLYLFLFSLF